MSNQHVTINRRRWELVRRSAFDRDGYRCTACGHPGRLEAHHETPLRDGADPYDLVGIVTLCRGCHIEHHRLHDETPGRAAWRALVDGMIKS